MGPLGYLTLAIILVLVIGAFAVLHLGGEAFERKILKPFQRLFFLREADFEGDGICISCDSSNVDWLGPQHYRCFECGYEGGEGLKQAQDQQRKEAIQNMPKGERIRSAADDLRTAESYIESAISHGQSLRDWIALDMIGMSESRSVTGSEQESTMNYFFSDLTYLEQALRDANDKLFDSTSDVPVAPDIDLEEWQFDVWVDNFFSDLQRRRDVKKILEYLDKIRPSIALMRSRLPSPD